MTVNAIMGLPGDVLQVWLEQGDAYMTAWCEQRVANTDDSGANLYYASVRDRVAALQAVSVDLPAVIAFAPAGDQRIPAVHNTVAFRAQGHAGQSDGLSGTNSAMTLTAVSSATQEG